jgi:nicotinamide riboside transporter PnuC
VTDVVTAKDLEVARDACALRARRWMDACVITAALLIIGGTHSMRAFGLGFLHTDAILFALSVMFIILLIKWVEKHDIWVRFDERTSIKSTGEWVEKERQRVEKG